MREWDDFDRFKCVIDKYMPRWGEGETKASQIVTAVNKLIYKWYNDGDVFDNRNTTLGWCNDLSSYANWLDHNTDCATSEILCKVFKADAGSQYEDLLYELAEHLLNDEYLMPFSKEDNVGTIYSCDGRFCFFEYEDED